VNIWQRKFTLKTCTDFYRAALNAWRSSHKNGVCPSVGLSVCPSVKHVQNDKTEERSVQIFIPHLA